MEILDDHEASDHLLVLNHGLANLLKIAVKDGLSISGQAEEVFELEGVVAAHVDRPPFSLIGVQWAAKNEATIAKACPPLIVLHQIDSEMLKVAFHL